MKLNKEFREDIEFLNKCFECGVRVPNDHIPESARDNKKFIEKILRKSASTFYPYLAMASDNLRNNQEIVRLAVSENVQNLNYASIRLKTDSKFIESVYDEIIKRDIMPVNRGNMDLAGYLKKDAISKELAKKAVKLNGRVIRRLRDELREDTEVVNIAVKNDWRALQWVRNKTPDLITLALEQSLVAIEFCRD